MKVILSVFGVIIVAFAGLYFFAMKGAVPDGAKSDARTRYEGYVEIEPVSLPEIKAKLDALWCHTGDYEGKRINWCVYRETKDTPLKGEGIEIYPQGPGFGPVSFYVTENKLWADKDIPGSPNQEKFKEAVRKDVEKTGNVVKIKEDSWKITKTQYPWTVIY